MHLHELMGWAGPMTHRQFKAWRRFEAMRGPDRLEGMVMRVAVEARFAGGFRKMPADLWRTPFWSTEEVEPKSATPDPDWEPGMPRPVTKEDIAAARRGEAMSVVTGIKGKGDRTLPVTYQLVDREGNLISEEVR